MGTAAAFLIGVVVGASLMLVLVVLTTTPGDFKKVANAVGRKSYPRRTNRPDVRRVVLRPVNKDEPPSRITQAVFRQNPIRKLREDDDPRDID